MNKPVKPAHPRVSVIVPNYNHARFLRQRLESIYNQTYRDFELIILDDKSTDNSVEVIETIISENKNSGIPTQFIVNETNSGSPFKQWKNGIEEARGEYIWIAESDDYSDRNFLATLMDRMTGMNFDLCFCQSQLVDEQGQFKGIYRPEKDFYQADKIFHMRDIQQYMTQWNIVPNASAVVVGKELSQPLIDEVIDYRCCGDWTFWALAIEKAKACGFIAAPLNYFRRHSNSVTIKGFQQYRQYIAEEIRAVARMHKAGYKCKINPWIEKWLEINNNRFSLLKSYDFKGILNNLRSVNAFAPFLIVYFYFRHRFRNIVIKLGHLKS